MADEPGKIGDGEDVSVTAASAEVASNPSMETEQIGQTGSIGLDEASEQEDTAVRIRRSRWNRRIALIGGIAALIGAAVVLPPLVNIGRYQHQIAAAMARSLGRPVRMSGVELRLLPRPGFVLSDLAVSEDPGFGVEPILSARTVTASVRLLSLWRGRLEVDRVSVDDASLNLVRSAQGRWNLDTLLMGSQPNAAGSAGTDSGGLIQRTSSTHFPYLEATNSRVNLKNGVEKSPFSLTGADLSLWQDAPGQWRVRLRGQPVRTDMEISAADTGEVRMEASLQTAAQLREMPLQLQMEWREAQLGQLSRLLLGSDAGWRGNLTADIDVRGTMDNAQTKARLRATGVRREEFAPDTPLDFDANCNFRYQHSQNALHDVGCDTAIGGGRLHLKAELPGNGGAPEATLEASQVPVQAGLDLLRTVRSGFAPGISARGTANGSIVYHEVSAVDPKTQPHSPARNTKHNTGQRVEAADLAATPANLTGTLTVDGAQLKGGQLKEPLNFPRITLTPALLTGSGNTGPGNTGPGNTELSTRFTVALGLAPAAGLPAASNTAAPPAAASPQTASQPNASVGGTGPALASTTAQVLNVHLGLGSSGYEAAVNGTAGIARIRDLAYAFGLPHMDTIDGLSGPAARIDFAAQGPWIESDVVSQIGSSDAATPASSANSTKQAKQSLGTATPAGIKSSSAASARPSSPSSGQESISGSLSMHHAVWKVAYLVRPVRLTQATMTISQAQISFTSNFAYGGSEDAAKDSLTKDSVKDAGKDATATGDGKDASGGDAAATSVAKDAAKGPGKSPAKTSIPDTIEGSVIVNVPENCKAVAGSPEDATGTGCEPQVQLRLGALNAATVEAALAGVPQEKGIFAPLIDRMRSPNRPKWPEARVSIQADSLVLGPATLQKPVIEMRLKASQIDLESWEADLLGGSAKGKGSFAWVQDKPQYSFDGNFNRISAATAGELLNTQWTGGPLSGNGSVLISGLTAKELAASVSGTLHFDWQHGVLSTWAPAESRLPEETHSAETKFDNWSGDVKIDGGKAQIGQNTLLAGKHTSSMTGTITLGSPAKVSIQSTAAKAAQARPAPPDGKPSTAPTVK